MQLRKLCFCLALFLTLPIVAAANLTLARGGKAQVVIACPAAPIPAETRAVKELGDYLQKITGATFAVVDDQEVGGKPAIYVGPTAFAKGQGIDVTALGKEESIIRTVGNSLLITGGRPRGTLYGVYRFLENQLGVRWYTPWTEKVPGKPTCTVGTLDLRQQPAFEMRDYYGIPVTAGEMGKLYGEEWPWWVQRNRLNGQSVGEGGWFSSKYGPQPIREETGGGWVISGPGNHSFTVLFPNTQYFKEHPEYYSMRNGKRIPGDNAGNHLCLTNKDVLRLTIEKVLNQFRQSPVADVVSVSQNDGGLPTLCDCPDCRAFVAKYGNEADLMIWFVNQVAEAVEQEYPGKFVSVLGGYQPITDAPKTFKPRENVIITYGNPGWFKVAKHVWAWNNYSNVSLPFGFFRPQWWRNAEWLKTQRAQGVSGIFAESENINMEPFIGDMYDLRAWLFTKLTEDPNQDVDALMQDFATGYCGAAGKYMYQYLQLQKSIVPRWPWQAVDFAYIDKAQQLFDRAEAAVKDAPVELARVREFRIALDLTTIVFRNRIIGDYLRHGGKLEHYPYPTVRLKARMQQTIATTSHPYWRPKQEQTMWVLGAYRKGRLCDFAKAYLERLYDGTEYTPLPDALRKIPPDRLVEIPCGALTGVGQSLENDPGASGGAALKYAYKKLPFEFGVYDHSIPGYIAEPRLLSRQDIKGLGYHLYRGGRFVTGKSSLIYLAASWEQQIPMFNFLDPAYLHSEQRNQMWAKPGQVWDWYVSLKVTGLEKDGDPEAIYADRVFLVNLGEAQTLRERGDAVPLTSMQMLARWPLDGDGSEWAPSGSGECNAVIQGGQWVPGRFEKALAFIGPEDAMLVPFDDPARTAIRQRLDFSKRSFTISLWFRLDSAQEMQTLFEQRADGQHCFAVRVNGPKRLSVVLFDPIVQRELVMHISGNPVDPTDGKWHQLVVGYDREKLQLFTVLDRSERHNLVVRALPAIEAPIRFGSGSTGYLHGALDEVSIYDGAAPYLHGGAGE